MKTLSSRVVGSGLCAAVALYLAVGCGDDSKNGGGNTDAGSGGADASVDSGGGSGGTGGSSSGGTGGSTSSGGSSAGGNSAGGSGGMGGANCDAPATEGLVLWLDADDDEATGGEAGPVTNWADKSGEGYDFTAPSGEGGGGGMGGVPNAPTLVVDAQNDRNVVHFDGDDELSTTEFAGLGDASTYTVLLVASGSDEDQAVLAGHFGDDHGLLFETSADNNFRFLHRMPFGSGGGDSLRTTSGIYSTGELQIVTGWRDETNQNLRRNGGTAEQLEWATLGFNEDLTLVLGKLRKGSDSRLLEGDIAEVLVYSRDLGEEERACAERYLAMKWFGVPPDEIDPVGAGGAGGNGGAGGSD